MKPFVLSCVAVVLSAASLLFSLHSPVVAKSEGAGPKPVKVFRGAGDKTTESFAVEPNWVCRLISYSVSSSQVLNDAGKTVDVEPTYFDGSRIKMTSYHNSKNEYELQHLELHPPCRFQASDYVATGGAFKIHVEAEGPWKIEIYQLPDEIP